MYKKLDETTVLRLSDMASIPCDGANTDYLEYLAWKEQGGELEPGEPAGVSVPQSVAALQFRLALLDARLLTQVEAAVAAGDTETRLAWEFSSSFERNGKFVLSLASIFGQTSEQVDNLFRVAASKN